MRAPMALGLCKGGPARRRGRVACLMSAVRSPGLLLSNNRRKDHSLARTEHPSYGDSSLYCAGGTAGVRGAGAAGLLRQASPRGTGKTLRTGDTRVDRVSVCERPAAQGADGTAPASPRTGPVSLKSMGNKERHPNLLAKEETDGQHTYEKGPCSLASENTN